MKVPVATIFVVAIVAAAGTYALLTMAPDSSAENAFGLTSTKMTLQVDDHADLSVWNLPDGKTYADIGWTCDDESVAKVIAGTVTAVGEGAATVTATVHKDGLTFTDTCKVTVQADPVENPYTVYNPYAAKYDSATLTGTGFLGEGESDAVLSLTFNQGGYIIISLCGSTMSWQGYQNSMGNTVYNYDDITMVVKQGSATVCTSVYDPAYSGTTPVLKTDGGITYNITAQSPAIFVKGLAYGGYDVTFTIADAYSSSTYDIEGHFEYAEGDGRYFTDFEYTRNYVWDADLTGTKTICKVKISYSYGDYWSALLKSNSLMITYRNGICNSEYERQCVDFCDGGRTVTDLEAALRAEFELRYPTLASDDEKYAQFIFNFVQIRFEYEYDYTLYYDCDSSHSSGTDVWAYSDMTVYTGLGDCEDTSILLSSLFKKAGFDSALIILPSHMMSGIVLPGYSYGEYFVSDSKSYFFCESTANSTVKIGYCSSNYDYKEYSFYILG